MKNIQRALLRTAVAAAIVGLSAPAFAADYSANIELDNTYRNDKEVLGDTTLKRGLEQSGRVEFNASGKVGEDLFVAGKGTFLAKKDGSCGIDDMWFQLGNKTFDVKLGRFEAYDLFPVPGDVLLDYAATTYRTNTLRGRMDKSLNYDQGQFHAAATFKSNFGLNLELGVIEFKQTEETAETVLAKTYPDKVKGFRPVVSYANGPFSMALGAEFMKYGNDNDEVGVGATVGYDFGPAKVNLNVAFGKDDSVDAVTHVEEDNAHKQRTIGVTASSTFGLKGGVIFAKNELAEGVDDGKVTTVYASYTHSLFDIKGATWSLGVLSSTVSGGYDSEDHSGYAVSDETGARLRFNYTF